MDYLTNGAQRRGAVRTGHHAGEAAPVGGSWPVGRSRSVRAGSDGPRLAHDCRVLPCRVGRPWPAGVGRGEQTDLVGPWPALVASGPGYVDRSWPAEEGQPLGETRCVLRPGRFPSDWKEPECGSRWSGERFLDAVELPSLVTAPSLHRYVDWSKKHEGATSGAEMRREKSRSKPMGAKLSSYDGASSLETFLARFDTWAEYCGWTKRTRYFNLNNLLWDLRGTSSGMKKGSGLP